MRYQFVDCRCELGNPGRGRELYLAGHVPGASFLDVDADLSAPARRGRPPSPSLGRRRSPTQPRGRDRRGRLRRRVRGHRRRRAALVAAPPLRARRLRRPRRSTRGAGRSAPARRCRRRPSSSPTPRLDDTIGADELAGRSASPASSSSTRALPARWRGEANPIDRVPGRIPGALNAPWNEPAALDELPPGELVAYCGSGVTACVLLHRLALAGREAKLYPGSWSEWEQRGLPLERG